jgi:diguanylate cyclase (GGDEF)-like protein
MTVVRAGGRLLLSVLGLWLWLLAAGVAADPLPLRLDAASAAKIDLRPHLVWRHDATGTLAVYDASAAAGYESLAPGSGLNFGYRSGALWLRLELEVGDDAPRDWRLEFDYASLDRVELFEPTQHGAQPWQVGGDTVPFAARSLPHRNPVFALALAPGERRSLLLRVQSESSLTLNPALWRVEAFARHSETGYAIHALYLGMLLALGGYNLLLWFALRDRAFLLYVAFAAGMGLGIASLYGLSAQYLWPDATDWANRAMCAGFALTGIVGPLFTRSFLRTASNAPRWHRVLGVLAWLHVAILALTLFGPVRASMQAMSIGTLANCLITLGCGVVCAWRGVAGARLFVAAWSMLLLGGAVMGLRNFGLLPTHPVTLYGIQIGSALEMLLLSFALAARFNQLKREKEQAQAETLASQQRLVQTLQQQERVLEERVAERTEALAAANARLRELALHDALTGLSNRAALHARLAQALDGTGGYGRSVALLMVDLDGFKAVNDRLGHEAGDRLLVAVAERLVRSARFNDLVARLGGDEFVLLVEDLTSRAQVQQLADTVLAALATPFALGGEVVGIGASIGVAIRIDADLDGDDLLRRADRAMYAAKAAGRGNVRWADGEIATARDGATAAAARD